MQRGVQRRILRLLEKEGGRRDSEKQKGRKKRKGNGKRGRGNERGRREDCFVAVRLQTEIAHNHRELCATQKPRPNCTHFY